MMVINNKMSRYGVRGTIDGNNQRWSNNSNSVSCYSCISLFIYVLMYLQRPGVVYSLHIALIFLFNILLWLVDFSVLTWSWALVFLNTIF